MRFLSQIYKWGAGCHRKLFEKNLLKTVFVGKTVVSVGNITFGGTGKTPFVLKLVQDLMGMGLKPAVVVKSYGGSARHSDLLDQNRATQPEIWGDEACWYAQKLQVPIYSGPQKWKSAFMASQNPAVNIIVVDDGFQHHKLHRDVDIVLVDALAGPRDLSVRAREDISALQKADAVVLTRTNLVSDVLKLPKTTLLFKARTQARGLRRFDGSPVSSFQRAGLISGIANPESFSTVFKQKFEGSEIYRLDFSDHHSYDLSDLEAIQKFKARYDLDLLVTTEKDEVKIRAVLGLQTTDWAVLEIGTEFEDEEKWDQQLRKWFQ